NEMMSTGAVVAGRGTFEPGGGWGGDHHDGVPIWVFSRREPGIDVSQWPLVTYVGDITTAMTEAKGAAGAKNVLVHGAGTAQLALAASVLDELELHVVPVLFGEGRRLFENLDPEQIELERTRILEGEAGVTHMHYAVHPLCPRRAPPGRAPQHCATTARCPQFKRRTRDGKNRRNRARVTGRGHGRPNTRNRRRLQTQGMAARVQPGRGRRAVQARRDASARRTHLGGGR